MVADSEDVQPFIHRRSHYLANGSIQIAPFLARTDDGGIIGPGWALLRTLILLTVIPPLLTDRDLRGLHDRAADTIVIRA